MRTSSALTLDRAKRLRKTLTPQELGLWLRLKNRRPGGFKFRCQHPIGPYILDFYCAEARLAVEIDGEVHGSADQIAHDERRDAYFRKMGIETLRLSTERPKSPLEAAGHILEVLRRPALSTTSWSPSPASGRGRADQRPPATLTPSAPR